MKKEQMSDRLESLCVEVRFDRDSPETVVAAARELFKTIAPHHVQALDAAGKIVAAFCKEHSFVLNGWKLKPGYRGTMFLGRDDLPRGGMIEWRVDCGWRARIGVWGEYKEQVTFGEHTMDEALTRMFEAMSIDPAYTPLAEETET